MSGKTVTMLSERTVGSWLSVLVDATNIESATREEPEALYLRLYVPSLK